ncbi:hypothetical protein V8F20_005202 [Naviculisporaceae sp. PSN 640]
MTPPIPLAVVGIGCRFPGDATSPDKLWDLLAEGKSAWSRVPSDRWNEEAFLHPSPDDMNGSHNHQGGHFLRQDVGEFDAGFFNVLPAEAAAMDPQQRLLLETTYEAIESAGIPKESLAGSRTAVYMAMFTRDYDRNVYKDMMSIPKYHVTGTGDAILANRISHLFDLRGPSMTIDTGCSGGMAAVSHACQALRSGASDVALAGAANLILSPDHMVSMSNLHMLNADGRSYAFDDRGAGYGRGEGIATLVIKRLDDAIKANDPIRAIIRDASTNQDGHTAGITLPSGPAQEALERQVWNTIGLDPREVGYVEAHGTGTRAGDSAELEGISRVFCSDRGDSDFLTVGSIKSNIGHTECVSGLAALIKSILVLEKEAIPPNVNFETPKPGLNLNQKKLRVPTALQKWSQPGIPRVSVNSFGYGGTNAHAVLEKAPVTTRQLDADADVDFNKVLRLFTLSAASQTSLQELSASIAGWVSQKQDRHSQLRDIAYTLSERRSLMAWRFWAVASDEQELIDALYEASRSTENISKVSSSEPPPKISFVFTGQGAQWPGMGRELLQSNAVFRESITRSNKILAGLGASWDLVEEIVRENGTSRLKEAELAQPATTALQIALVDLAREWGIVPDSVVGHSSGEIAATYAAGYLSHHQAVTAAYYRGFSSTIAKSKGLGKGGMLAVGLGEDDIAPYLTRLSLGNGKAVVACQNSPKSVTISGDDAAITELSDMLAKDDVFNRRLLVDTAYHSHHMEAAADEYRASLGKMETPSSTTGIKMFSSVTGSLKADGGFNTNYWVSNLVGKVRFCDALQALCRHDQNSSCQGHRMFIEIGPHAALAGPLRQSIADLATPLPHTYLSALARGTSALQSALSMAGTLFLRGYPLNMSAVNNASSLSSSSPPSVVPNLPTYAWDHTKRHWHESRLSRDYRMRKHAYHDLLGLRMTDTTPLRPVWRHMVGVEGLPWLRDHVVDGLIIFPGAGYLCMALQAAEQLVSDTLHPNDSKKVKRMRLRDVAFLKGLVIPDSTRERVEVQLVFTPLSGEGDGDSRMQYSFSVTAYTSDDDKWTEHCRGSVLVEFSSPSPSQPTGAFEVESQHQVTYAEAMMPSTSQPGESIAPAELYRSLRKGGNAYGPTFSTIQKFELRPAGADASVAMSTITVPDIPAIMPANHMKPHIIHPSTLDVLLHTTLPLVSRRLGVVGSVMPVRIDDLVVDLDGQLLERKPHGRFAAVTSLTGSGFRSAETDLLVFPASSSGDVPGQSTPVISVMGMELRSLAASEGSAGASAAAASEGVEGNRDLCYDMKWLPDERFLSASSAKAVESAPAASSIRLRFIAEPDLSSSPHIQALVTNLQSALRKNTLPIVNGPGSAPLITSWADLEIQPAPDSASLITIVLDNGAKPILSTVASNPPIFRKIVSLLQDQPSRVLWVSLSDSNDKAHIVNPEKHLITGLARTAHAENELLELVTVDVQEQVRDTSLGGLVDFLAHIVPASLVGTSAHGAGSMKEREYVYLGENKVLVPRVLPSPSLNRQIRKSKEVVSSTELFVQATPLKLDVATGKDGSAATHVATFVEDESHRLPLGQDFVDIEAKAFGLGSSATKGRSSGASVVTEYAGVVTALGSDVVKSFGLKVGDRVMAWAEGSLSFASRPRIPASQVRAIPDSVPFATAAALPVSLTTAYHALVEVSDVQPGQLVFIDGAATETGQVALCVAKFRGASLIVSVSTTEEAAFLQENFGLPIGDILPRESPFLRYQIKKLLGSAGGIDVLLACASSAVPSEIVKAQKPFGTLVQIGATPISGVVTSANGTIVSVDPASFLAQIHPTKAARLFDSVMEMVHQGLGLDSLRVESIPMTNLTEAFKLARRHDNMTLAKFVLEVDQTAMVRVARPSYIVPKLDENATYVIAGGLGDLGQRLLRLMAKAGARYFVTLSRSGASDGQHDSLERELRSISPASSVTLLCLKCDVSKEVNVQQSLREIKTAGFPRVQGVIQASVVLGDSTLGNMTAQDFDRVLHAKASGTLHLQRVFSTEGLDFFISLSSAVNIIGSAGQANYNAANSLQDAVAQFDTSSDGCFYMTLNIGLIEDGAVNNNVIVQSLQREGLTPIYHDELDAYFEYALSAEARQAGSHQTVIGFTPESVAKTSTVNGAAKTLMFTHVSPQVSKQGPGGEVNEAGDKSGAPRTFAEFVAQGTHDKDEIEEFAAQAIANKLADLMLIEPEDVELDESLDGFGLDSLIAIELRNWIMRELGSPIQTSEVLGSEHILALARKVTSRSVHVTGGVGGDASSSNSDDMAPTTADSSTVPTSVPTTVTTPSRSPSQEPPVNKTPRQNQGPETHLPIPDLASTLHMLVESRSAICSPEEKQETEQVIKDFVTTDGPALAEALRSGNQSNSDARLDFYNSHIHLERREPLQDHAVFFLGHLTETADGVPAPKHSQAERAAIVTGAAMHFKRRLEAGTVEQHKLNDLTLCMDTLQWLFHTAQEPGITTDIAQKYPSNNKVVVLRKGNFFEVDVHPDDDYSALEQVFSQIIEASDSPIPTPSVLTTKPRHEWAALRSQIQSLSPANADTLSAIESCAFLVSLDDSSPETSSERFTSILLNDLHLSNRWLDKMLSFTVASNGVSSLLGENTMLDGLSARQLHEYVTDEIFGTPTLTSTSTTGPSSTIRPLSFTLTNELIQTIESQIRQNLRSYHPISSSRRFYSQLNRAFLGSKGMRSKGTVLVAIAMATRLFFGHYEPLWETVTLAKHAQGRIDWLQTLTPDMVAFVDAVIALGLPTSSDSAINTTTLSDLSKQLKQVTLTHIQNIHRVADGRGYVENMYSLMGAALARGEKLPEIFKSEMWKNTDRHLSPKFAKTDCLGSGGYLRMQEGGFLMPNPGSLFIHYEVHHRDPLVNVSGRAEDVTKFEGILGGCLAAVRRIVDA